MKLRSSQALMMTIIVVLTINTGVNLFTPTKIDDQVQPSVKKNVPISQKWINSNAFEHQELLNVAINQMHQYFQGDVAMLNQEIGPMGSLLITASINDEEREFIMLADKNTLIEGTIYHPYLTQSNITKNHSAKSVSIAKENQKIIDTVSGLKQDFKESLVPKTSVTEVVESTDYKISPQTPDASIEPLAFRLPENNSVFTSQMKRDFYNNTEMLQYVEFGDENAPVIYVYFDFECGSCIKAKKLIQPYIDSKAIRVRYVPLGVMRPDSAVKAAYSLIPNTQKKKGIVFNYFQQSGTASKLIKKKAPELDFVKAMRQVKSANDLFFKSPKQRTPLFTYEYDGEAYLSNITSTDGLKQLIQKLNK